MTTATTTRLLTSYSHNPGAYTINHYRQGSPATVLHRTDGPASLSAYPNQSNDHLNTIWFEHGTEHRTNGPALTLSGGDVFWFVEGHNITHTEGLQ